MAEHADQLWVEQADALERTGQIELPWVRDAITWLTGVHAGALTHVVDAGAGPGVAACAIADAIPGVAVTAVDRTGEFLDRALRRAASSGVATQVTVRQADLSAGALDLPPADLVWASHVVHHLADPVDVIRNLGHLLTTDGIVAIAEGGLAERVLPGGYGVGRPSTLLRIAATLSDYYVDTYELAPAAIGGSRDWPLMIEDAGLQHVQSRTFLLDLPAPVTDKVRHHVHQHWATVAGMLSDQLEAEERAALERLIDPDDPGGLLRRADLFLLAAYTVHVARRRS